MRKTMKSFVTALLAAAMIIPQGWGIPAAEAAAPAPGEQIAFYDFEDGTQGWTGRGGSAVSVTTEDVYAGVNSLLSSGRTASWHGPGRDVSALLQKGAKYEISAFVKLAAGQTTSDIKLSANQPGSGNAYPQISNPTAVTDAAWVELKGSYTYDSAATAAVIYAESPNNPTARFVIDNVEIILVEPATDPAVVQPSEFVYDFEDNTAQGWVGRGGTEVVEPTSEAANTGRYSLKTTNRALEWHGPNANVTSKIVKRVDYEISAYFKFVDTPATPSSVKLSMEVDVNGSKSWTTIASAPIGNTEWVQLKGFFTLNADATVLGLYVESAKPSDAYYIDDVVIRSAAPPAADLPIQKDIPKLSEMYANYFKVGAAVEPYQLSGKHRELLDYQYSALVAENAMKPAYLAPGPGDYQWANADQIINYANASGKYFRFHTLVWHSQAAEWMFQDEQGNDLTPSPENKRLVLQRLESYIRTVVGRYKDKVDAWDVVNEVIDESQPNGMRNSRWYQLTGLDYIRTAFRVTREVDPDGKLYINDYNTDNPKKRDFLFDLVQQLRSEGVPIEGVGHQTHINIANPSIAQISESIRKFGEAGLDNQITELDVSVYTGSSEAYQVVPEELLVKQGYRYKELFEELKRLDQEGDYISAVMFWGVADDRSWLNNRPVTRQDAPLPFDKQLQAKPAYWGMVDPSKLPVTAKTAETSYGKPVVDGKPDLVWSTAPALETETKGGLKAAFKTLWDEGSLYVWAEIDDAVVSAQDKIDVFAGAGGLNTSRSIARSGEPAAKGASRAVTEVEGGYVLEAAIPLPSPLSVGGKAVFDLRVTDGDTNTTASWSDLRGNQEAEPSGLGTLTLNEATYAAKSVYGTPIIDGEPDAVWTKAQERFTERWAEGADGAKAKFRTLWDQGRLYVYAEVTDSLLTDASANAWEEDSVEIFLDQNNGKTGFYQGDDGQYRINFNNVQSYGGRASAQNLTSAVKIVDGGYIVEAAIAFDAVPPAENGVIGFDLQVNDDRDGNGSRDSVAMWSDPTGQSYTNTSRLGVLQLVLSDLPAPTNVSAKALNHQAIRVNWSDVEDAYGYDVYRATGRSGPFEKVNKKPVRSSRYVDHKLQDDTTYYYKVTAIDKNGESAASETVSSTTEKSKGKGKKNKED